MAGLQLGARSQTFQAARHRCRHQRWQGRTENLRPAQRRTRNAAKRAGRQTADRADSTTTTPASTCLRSGERGLGRDVDCPNYVVISGCQLAEGGEYAAVTRPSTPCAPAPEWIYDMIGKGYERPERDEAPAVELNQPHNIERTVDYLKEIPPAIEGEGGDDCTYCAAAWCHSHGAVSEDVCLELMAEVSTRAASRLGIMMSWRQRSPTPIATPKQQRAAERRRPSSPAKCRRWMPSCRAGALACG